MNATQRKTNPAAGLVAGTSAGAGMDEWRGRVLLPKAPRGMPEKLGTAIGAVTVACVVLILTYSIAESFL